ncbi:MAG: metallophosphoesterase family protein [Planctomycetota bacterium]|nr:metallophosphoesterase family protein [Planctomycetota bacterium]
MAGPIVILSDTHLGRPHSSAVSAKALSPLWAGASRLILNGDVAEVHHPKYAERAEDEMISLFEQCEIEGVILTLLSGNHDPYLSDLRHVHIANDSIFVTHGDVLHPAIAPWSPAAPYVRMAHEEALSQVPPEDRDHLEARLAVSRYASTRECELLCDKLSSSTTVQVLRRPWSILQVLHYWHVIPSLAACFTKTHCPKAKFMIFGHTHRPGIWEFEGLTVINTGCYGFPGHPRAVTIEGQELKVWAIKLKKGEYRLAREPIKRYELPEAVSAPSALNTRPVIFRPNAKAM